MPKKRVVHHRRRVPPPVHISPSRWSRLPPWGKGLVTWGGALGVLLGAYLSFDKVMDIVERQPWWIATHQHVHDKVGPILSTVTGINSSLQDIQLDGARGKRDATSEAISKWQAELAKKETLNPQLRTLAEDRLRDLTNTRDSLDRQIRSLERTRAQQH